MLATSLLPNVWTRRIDLSTLACRFVCDFQFSRSINLGSVRARAMHDSFIERSLTGSEACRVTRYPARTRPNFGRQHEPTLVLELEIVCKRGRIHKANQLWRRRAAEMMNHLMQECRDA